MTMLRSVYDMVMHPKNNMFVNGAAFGWLAEYGGDNGAKSASTFTRRSAAAWFVVMEPSRSGRLLTTWNDPYTERHNPRRYPMARIPNIFNRDVSVKVEDIV